MEHPQKTSPKKRRGPPSRAAVLRWVLAAIACSGVLAYFPSVCSAVFLALLVLLVPIGPLEKRLAQFAPRLRRVRTAAIAALFLLAACIAPRETAEPPRRSALSKRAFRRRQRRLPRTNRRRSSRQSPIYPTPNRNPRHPLTSIRSRKHRPPLNRKFPPLPRQIPRRRSRPRPPCSRRRSTLPRRARNNHRAGCRHLQKTAAHCP